MIFESPIDDIDIIFISYDEPEKERHWADLLKHTPFAKRVDGVKGFDAAHKEAARLAETDRFITVDGDTTVDPAFFEMTLRYDTGVYDNHVFSWAGTNAINGLVYGNGSLKCWPRKQTLTMNTHEAALEERALIEFCWTVPYLSMKDSYSTTHPAATPYHGFRAGFREGVKMALNGGKPVDHPSKLFQTIWHGNAHKLMGWASLGADHENGLWAIYGARLGLHLMNTGTFDVAKIADYHWFTGYWSNIENNHVVVDEKNSHRCSHTGFHWDASVLEKEIDRLGESILQETGMYIPRFTAEQSKLYKYMTSYKERETTRVLFPE